MLTSEATIISNYIKNGLAEPQMIVLADMIHDLEGMIFLSNLFLMSYSLDKLKPKTKNQIFFLLTFQIFYTL